MKQKTDVNKRTLQIILDFNALLSVIDGKCRQISKDMGDLNDTNYQLYLNNCSIRILFTCIENTDLELTLAIKYVSVNFRTVKVYMFSYTKKG